MPYVRAQCKKDESKTNTQFPRQTVRGSADALDACLCDTGCHYSLWTWSQRCDSRKQVLIGVNKNEGFWLLMNSRQRALQWFIRQTVQNRALCYEIYIIRNAFSLGILGRKWQAQEFRMRPLYLTADAEGCILWEVGSSKGHWEMWGPSFTWSKSLHVSVHFSSF